MSATMVKVPARSRVQRLDALEKANDVRIRRAHLKHDLKAGTVAFVDVLIEPPEWLETAKVHEFLLAVPCVGPVKADKVFARCGVSTSRTFAGLTATSQRELLRRLGSSPAAVRRLMGGRA